MSNILFLCLLTILGLVTILVFATHYHPIDEAPPKPPPSSWEGTRAKLEYWIHKKWHRHSRTLLKWACFLALVGLVVWFISLDPAILKERVTFDVGLGFLIAAILTAIFFAYSPRLAGILLLIVSVGTIWLALNRPWFWPSETAGSFERSFGAVTIQNGKWIKVSPAKTDSAVLLAQSNFHWNAALNAAPIQVKWAYYGDSAWREGSEGTIPADSEHLRNGFYVWDTSGAPVTIDYELVPRVEQ